MSPGQFGVYLDDNENFLQTLFQFPPIARSFPVPKLGRCKFLNLFVVYMSREKYVSPQRAKLICSAFPEVGL